MAVSIPVIHPLGDPTTTSGTSLLGTLGNVADTIINILLFLALAIAVIYIILAGYQYITSNGVPDKIKQARQSIINAVIGIVIIVAAFFFIRLGVTGGNILSNADHPSGSTGMIQTSTQLS